VELRTPNLGEEEAKGSVEMVQFERALGVPIGLYVHSNVSSIYTRFRDIAAFVLQHTTFSDPFL